MDFQLKLSEFFIHLLNTFWVVMTVDYRKWSINVYINYISWLGCSEIFFLTRFLLKLAFLPILTGDY